MARNPYFTQGTTLERGLYEDLVIEQIKIYGQDVKYIPRALVDEDNLFHEDSMSRFTGAYEVEMYVANIDGFQGDGDLYSKFGIRVTDQVTFIVARKRFKDAVDDNCDLIVEGRPNEGDLIYFSLTQKLFEIRYVEYKKPFYQLQNPLGAFVYELKCELFEYSHEDFETGDPDIDSVESDYGVVSSYVLLSGGSGEFEVGEIISNNDPISPVTAEVASWNPVTRELKVSRRSGDFSAGDILTGETSDSSWTISTLQSNIDFESNELDMSMNKYFEEEGNLILDFSEKNPFGEYGSYVSPGDVAPRPDTIISNMPQNPSTTPLVITYDVQQRRYEFADPDQILIAAANSTTGEVNPNGLPTVFTDEVTETVEQAIDESTLDGGNF